jgi:hypothetical protein
VVVECGPVEPAEPSVRAVRIRQNERGLIEAQGEYSGGTEGLSFIVWRLYGDTVEKVGKSVERELTPTARFVGREMDVVYVPVRADGCAGAPVVSANRIVVAALPRIVSAEILAKGGPMVAGAPLHCRAKASPGAKPTFQWSRGDGSAWEKIDGATDREYVPGIADVGFGMLCAVVAVDGRGWTSGKLTVQTSDVVKGAAKQLLLSEANWPDREGVKKLVAGIMIETTLIGASLTKAKIRWERETGGKWEALLAGDHLLVTCNDIGHRLRAVAATGLASLPTQIVEAREHVWSCADENEELWVHRAGEAGDCGMAYYGIGARRRPGEHQGYKEERKVE